MLYSLFILIVTVCPLLAMDSSILVFPKEIFEYIAQSYEAHHTRYSRNVTLEYLFPYTLSPAFVRYSDQYTPLDTDLTNPQEDSEVLPHVQYWHNEQRLSEDIRKTDDIYKRVTDDAQYRTLFFDGINTNNYAIYAVEFDDINKKTHHALYAMKQAKKFGDKRKRMRTHLPLRNGTAYGKVTSLMLENSRNRIMYSHHREDENHHTLHIKYIEKQQGLLGHTLIPIAERTSLLGFSKTINLGRDTYLGITQEGTLYCIWLDAKNSIHYAQQTFSDFPKKIKDIAVDMSVSTERGFYPKIALLTEMGEVFIVNLTEYKTPTLLPSRTLLDPDDIQHFYYRDGSLSVVYTTKNEIISWKDNFEFLYFRSLWNLINAS